MARHHQTGKKGELLAVEFLKSLDFAVLELNWRYSHYEIDIIASRVDILHFIEVKTRNGNTFGFPEESVSNSKLSGMMKCAEEFQIQYPEWNRIQYDVLSINISVNQRVEFFFIEDVYL